jgi:hypothetical protein
MESSLRLKLVSALLIVIMPLVQYLYYVNQYGMKEVRVKSSQSTYNLVYMFMKQLDQTLESTDRQIYNYLSNDPDLKQIDKYDTSSADYMLAKYFAFILHIYESTWNSADYVGVLFHINEFSFQNPYMTIEDNGSKYIAVGASSQFLQLHLQIVSSEEQLLTSLLVFQRTIYLIPLALAIILLTYILLLQNVLIRPMGAVVRLYSSVHW